MVEVVMYRKLCVPVSGVLATVVVLRTRSWRPAFAYHPGVNGTFAMPGSYFSVKEFTLVPYPISNTSLLLTADVHFAAAVYLITGSRRRAAVATSTPDVKRRPTYFT